MHILHETYEFAHIKHLYYVFLEIYAHLMKHHPIMNRKNLHSKYSCLGIPINSNTFVSSVQSIVCFNRYQDKKYKDICSQDVCWEAFIYPISSYYEGVDKDQVLVQVLLIIVILIGFLVFLRPWWYII